MKSPTALRSLPFGRERASYGFEPGLQRMRTTRRPARQLRQAIDCMPLETRVAMREAVAVNPIIVGAYTDGDGGVCPMLAAHRNGGRTSLASFARAWDRYTGAGKRTRRATDRELRVLTAMLDASIAVASGGPGDELRAAIAEHRASGARSARRPARRSEARRLEGGERDRTGELERREGWAWLRPFRRLDDYERALGELDGKAAREKPLERTPA